MKLRWLGHASFLITADDGTRIIMDPFGEYAGLRYEPIREAADVMLVSHDHGDHRGAKVRGNPTEVKSAGMHKVGGIEFKGIPTYHDAAEGRERGRNLAFCFTVDGLRVCHLGDLGHELSKSQLAEIGQVDVLMVPVGGFYTIDAAAASAVCDQIKPKVVIPMHFKTSQCDFPIAGVEEFLKGKPRVRKLDTTEIELSQSGLPKENEVIVFKTSL
jgi:L-ascorbate metabolism protein UlaG (beta-lactamase superfamily)